MRRNKNKRIKKKRSQSILWTSETARRFKDLRERLGIRPKDLAKEIGIRSWLLSRIENGLEIPPPALAQKLIDAVGMGVADWPPWPESSGVDFGSPQPLQQDGGSSQSYGDGAINQNLLALAKEAVNSQQARQNEDVKAWAHRLADDVAILTD